MAEKKSEYFLCERLNCTLREEVCGKRWRIASNAGPKRERVSSLVQQYMSCHGCPIGQKNARKVKAPELFTLRLGHVVAQGAKASKASRATAKAKATAG